ncbi:MAG: patatin-like phospholipase family protein [Janthinobacterium lividum]
MNSGVASRDTARPNGTPFESVALLLQGGGALGAYQAGVYEALVGHGIRPTWVAGISIGAINSAIIAGNDTAEGIAKLRGFWEFVSDAGDGGMSHFWSGLLSGDVARGMVNQIAASQIMTNGVPGFFKPRFPPPYLSPNGSLAATSWYDTATLRSTLERFVDFDRINAKETRFSVGAVNVRTGNFAYFDNATDTIRPEHIMASGALPPAFPAVEIDGEFYWDGGMVSNTPLDWVLSSRSDLDTLVLQIDLWSARGELPRDLSEVAVRMKEVQFSSRTRAATDAFRKTQKLRAVFNDLLAKLPPELAGSAEAKILTGASDPAVFNIVQLIYRSPTYEGQSKDYEFSRRTMEEHWAAGLRDATRTLAHPEVLTPPTDAHGVDVYDFTSKE